MPKGYRHTIETKNKIRLKHLGKKLAPLHRLKVIKTLSSYKDQRGEKNPLWKGGKTITNEGYVLIRKNNKYIKEHRLVMEEYLGRELNFKEIVHHINGDKTDNRIENLMLLTHNKHGKLHWTIPEIIRKQSIFIKKIRKNKFWSTKKKGV